MPMACVGLVFGSKNVQFHMICLFYYSISINTTEVDPHSDSLHNGRAVERGGTTPGPGPKRGPDTNCYKFTSTARYEVKSNRRLTEKRLRAYGFLQTAFINGKILEPTTDLNSFSLMKRKISYTTVIMLALLCQFNYFI